MSKESISSSISRFLSSSDVREESNRMGKALIIQRKGDFSNVEIADGLGVDEASIRRAKRAHVEGRDICRNGRPPKFKESEERSICEAIEAAHLAWESMTVESLLVLVRPQLTSSNYFSTV